jgi:protein-tyrosine phosphatase
MKLNFKNLNLIIIFYLGVHCTHGFNRTGFMIITYLIEELHFNVTSAITHFAAAR